MTPPLPLGHKKKLDTPLYTKNLLFYVLKYVLTYCVLVKNFTYTSAHGYTSFWATLTTRI